VADYIMKTNGQGTDVPAHLLDQSGCHQLDARATPAQLAVHNNFKESVRTLKRSLLRSIFYLRIIKERRIHKVLGYKTIVDYAAREAGLGRRQCESFLSMGRKLRDLPQITTRLKSGQLTWRQAEEICRVAKPDTEAAWIETATGLTVRELEAAVRDSRATGVVGPGEGHLATEPDTEKQLIDTPRTASPNAAAETHRAIPVIDTPRNERCPAPENTPHYMTFKFTPTQYALWENWLAQERQRDTSTP